MGESWNQCCAGAWIEVLKVKTNGSGCGYQQLDLTKSKY